MKYGLQKNLKLNDQGCLALGIFNDSQLHEFAFSRELHALLPRLVKRLYEPGDMIWQGEIEGYSLLLIHCGQAKDFTAAAMNKRLKEIMAAVLKQHIDSLTICMPSLKQQNADWQLKQMVLTIDAECYQLLDFKSNQKNRYHLQQIDIHLPNADETALHDAKILADSIAFTKKLADLPANRCTPTYLKTEAEKLAKTHTAIKTTAIDAAEMAKMGMGALLAVAKGSAEPPYLIQLNYQGGNKELPPIVLAGKGITFDSGGLSLKPANAMDEMKYDMAGAATVLGTIKACAEMQLPINVIGLIACTENMPSGTAVKPGDIVTSLSGQTIEILNTDAEGRLVLADALTYAERFKPQFVIDIATLTGAMIIALGAVNTGFMTEDEELAQLIFTAANLSQDKCWRMPLEEEYQEVLDSPIADMINASFDRNAGSITAACFLSRFTKNYRWAHLDIAGTAWISGKKRHATGRPVGLLVELLSHVAKPR